MEKTFVNLETFKKTIDGYDQSLLRFWTDLESLLAKRDAELQKASKDSDAYLKKIIDDNVSVFANYKQSVSSLVQKLKSAFPSLSASVRPGEKTYANIEDAIKCCNELSTACKQAISDINNYEFEEISFKADFDGEKATIGGTDYSAPGFPELSSKDFDTDSIHKEKAQSLLDLCGSLIKCLDYIIAYYSGITFKNILLGKSKNASSIYSEQINSEYSSQEDSIKEKANEYYKTTCVPFLIRNNEAINDYVTLENLRMPTVFLKQINIGTYSYSFNNYDLYKDFAAKLDKESLIKKTISSPCYLDLTNKGNVLINADKVDKKLVDFIYQLVLQFITVAPFRKLNLALVDVDEMDAFDFDFNFNKDYLRDNKLIFSGKPVSDKDDFRELANLLVKKLKEIKGEKLAPKNSNNIFEYNEVSTENPQELYLMVYVNCPKCLDESISERIANIMVNGPKCGVFSILLNNTSYSFPSDSYGYNQEKHDEFIKQVSSNSTVFNYSSSVFKVGKDVFVPNYAFREDDLNSFFASLLNESKKAPLTKAISLAELAKQPYERDDFSKRLKIPVGKDGGDPVYFELDVVGSNISSALVAGGTGSGKSTFLHTIILSGAYNYSPDELEFYLIDFKDGVEFSPYANKESGLYIPHVSFLSLKNRIIDAYDMLQKIKNEKMRRNYWFTKAGVNKLSDYQSHPKVLSKQFPSFKRLIVIIDEYQNFLSSAGSSNDSILCNKCADALRFLLADIRNSGISIVLASQEVALSRESRDLIGNRYIFNASPNVLQFALQESSTSGEEMSRELSKEVGLAYKTTDGGFKKQLFKSAFSGSTGGPEQRMFVKEINEKWGNQQRELIISGDTSPLPIYMSKAPFVRFEKMEQDDDYNIPVCFGESALSGDLSTFNFVDGDFCSYVILGLIKKARKVEASIGLSFLYDLKQFDYEIEKGCLTYLDLSNTKDARRNPSPFAIYQDDLESVMNYALEPEEIEAAVNDLYNDFLKRKENSRKSRRGVREDSTPRLLIVSSFYDIKSIMEEVSHSDNESVSEGIVGSEDNLGIDSLGDWGTSPSSSYSGDLSLEEKIKILYKDGHSYDIYVVLQEKRGSDFKENDDFVKFTKVICLDEEEIHNCLINESGDTVEIDDLPDSFAVLFPVVSKVRPYDFDESEKEKEFIRKYVEALTDEQ